MTARQDLTDLCTAYKAGWEFAREGFNGEYAPGKEEDIQDELEEGFVKWMIGKQESR